MVDYVCREIHKDTWCGRLNVEQTPVVQKVDSAIHWINHYTVDNTVGFRPTYPLDSAIQLLNN